MREANFIIYQDSNGCHAAKVENTENFYSLVGVATAIKNSRSFRKTNVVFLNHRNGFSNKELQEVEKILK